MKPTRTIRWVLYHEPIHLFLRTAKVFAEEIGKLTGGRINVEVYTKEEYADKFKNGVQFEPIALIQNDDVEMSQMQVSVVGVWDSPDFFALEMPYLFRDHDHATRVLDGAIGRGLLDSLQEKTPVHGLAFTYSGGFRVIASDRDIRKTDDIAGLNVITSTNPVMVETVEQLGGNPIPVMIRDLRRGLVDEIVDKNMVYSLETTLPRYEYEADPSLQKHIIDTQHSMYLTTILISKEFWNSLDQEDQEYVRTAARSAAVQEREWSVDEADEYAENIARHKELGITYTKLSNEELDKMKEVVEPLYTKYKDLFSPGLIDNIFKS